MQCPSKAGISETGFFEIQESPIILFDLRFCRGALSYFSDPAIRYFSVNYLLGAYFYPINLTQFFKNPISINRKTTSSPAAKSTCHEPVQVKVLTIFKAHFTGFIFEIKNRTLLK